MRVYDMIDVSSALHFQQEIFVKDTYPSVTFILHSLMDLLLVSSKTTLSSCFLITYPAKIFYVFVNRIVMFKRSNVTNIYHIFLQTVLMNLNLAFTYNLILTLVTANIFQDLVLKYFLGNITFTV